MNESICMTVTCDKREYCYRSIKQPGYGQRFDEFESKNCSHFIPKTQQVFNDIKEK